MIREKAGSPVAEGHRSHVRSHANDVRIVKIDIAREDRAEGYMNYLKSIADALSAATFNFRRTPSASPRPATLSRTELRQIVAEALG